MKKSEVECDLPRRHSVWETGQLSSLTSIYFFFLNLIIFYWMALSIMEKGTH